MLEIDGYAFDYGMETRFSPTYGKPMDQLTLAIPGGGCAWYQKTKGDCCPFCAFPGLTDEITGGQLLATSTFGKMLQEAVTAHPTPEKLAVFNGGSFIVDSEIPPEFRREVYEYVAGNPAIRQLMFESKPEYMHDHLLEEMVDLTGDTDVMVGIGLESANAKVRNKTLKKGISTKIFEEKVRLMQKLGIQVFVYVFLKAPSMNEREAWTDAVATIRYLHNLGVDEIAISCAFVQETTLVNHMYDYHLKTGEDGGNAFRPPWLWTILEIAQEAEKNGWPISIGGFDDHPTPRAIASNCAKCDEQVMPIIDLYRETGTLSISANTNCSCRKDWERAVA